MPWLSAATASGSHSISIIRGVWPRRASQAATVSVGGGGAAPGFSAPPSLASGSRSRQPTPAQRSDAGGKVPRRRQPRTPEPRPPAGAVDEGDVEAVLQRHAIAGADGVEEPEGLVVAAGEHVLAVVDAVAGLAIVERRGPSAEASARFEHEHAPAGRGQADRRRQAGEARADDDDVGCARSPRATSARRNGG